MGISCRRRRTGPEAQRAWGGYTRGKRGSQNFSGRTEASGAKNKDATGTLGLPEALAAAAAS